MKGFNFYTYPEQAINSLPSNMRTLMSINNPFGMEIDDDGLPKYSPDRNNITAYHMYNLGLTDKLPDPEDTHTPFFRTPSYYAEKERQNRENANTFPQFDPPAFKQDDYPKLAAANTGTKTDAGMPPLVTPHASPNRKQTSSSPWEGLFKTMGQAWLQLNPAATTEDIREAFGHDNTGTVSQTPVNPLPKQSQAQTGAQTGSGMNPSGFNATPQTARAASVNPDNPDCLPLETAYMPPASKKGIPPSEYHPVSRELTRDINQALTRQFGCKPYGIDHAQISKWEGGNQRSTYVPWWEGAVGNKSGITVGSGVDFGQKNMNSLKRMQLPDDIIDVLKDRLGLIQGAAKQFNKNNPHTFSWDQIDKINGGAFLMHSIDAIRDWDRRILKARTLYPNAPLFHEMTSPQQTLVFSRYYHQGTSWPDNTSNQSIFNAIRENNWEKVRQHWDNLKNHYEKNGPEWKHKRFRDEYDYFWPPEE